MKVVRYSVQEHPDGGFAVMELCSDWYAHGACRYELWCQCVHSDGGPLALVVRVFDVQRDALAFADTLEAAQGGIREVNFVARSVCPSNLEDGDVPY